MRDTATTLWARHRRILQPAMFLAGVAWDYLTLRIDRPADQLLMWGYLGALLLALAADMRLDRGAPVPRFVRAGEARAELAVSFFLGALLSALGISVMRATHPGPAAVFLLILLTLAVANELGLRLLRGPALRYGLVACVTYQLTMLSVPFVLGRMVSPTWGMVGTGAAVVSLFGVVHGGTPVEMADVRRALTGVAAGLSVLAAAIALHLMPSLPLVLRSATVARDVVLTEGGGYRLVDPLYRSALARVLEGPAQIAWTSGQGVALFTPIYAPPRVELTLESCWEHRDPSAGWVRSDCIPQDVSGGRREGFRTWTRKENLRYGSWRVLVQTRDGHELGRVRFEVVRPAEE